MGCFYGVIKWLLGSSEWLLWRYYAGSRVLWLVMVIYMVAKAILCCCKGVFKLYIKLDGRMLWVFGKALLGSC